MFFGRFDHSLDSKGRVILPARFRSAFDATAYLTAHDRYCLGLWTPEAFEEEFALVRSRENHSDADRARSRLWMSSASEEKLDAQGRIMIPARLREYAAVDIDSPVVVVGSGDRIELWNPDRWESETGPFQESLADASWRLQGGAPVAATPTTTVSTTEPGAGD